MNCPKDHCLHPVPTELAPETGTLSKQATARRPAGPFGSRAQDTDSVLIHTCWEINRLSRAPVSIGVTPRKGVSSFHRQRAPEVSAHCFMGDLASGRIVWFHLQFLVSVSPGKLSHLGNWWLFFSIATRGCASRPVCVHRGYECDSIKNCIERGWARV